MFMHAANMWIALPNPPIPQVLLRTSDFAFFLLTGLDQPAYQNSVLMGRPFDFYMTLCRNARASTDAVKPAELERPVQLSRGDLRVRHQHCDRGACDICDGFPIQL